MTHPQVRPDPAFGLLKLYDDALPHVYGYLLVGVARHKLADHWRRVEREQRGLRLLDGEPARVDDPWETAVDRIRAREVLDRLGAHHRTALTLRYLDGLGAAGAGPSRRSIQTPSSPGGYGCG